MSQQPIKFKDVKKWVNRPPSAPESMFSERKIQIAAAVFALVSVGLIIFMMYNKSRTRIVSSADSSDQIIDSYMADGDDIDNIII